MLHLHPPNSLNQYKNLYPQKNRDNPVSNPKAATSSALPDIIIGQVVVNDPQKSITRETLNKSLLDNGVGVGLTNITSFSNGKDHILYTDIDHGFDGITGVTVGSPGFNYADGNYYNVSLVGFAGSTTGYSHYCACNRLRWYLFINQDH